MSGGQACTVRAHRPSWRVTARRMNFSAFNGYRATPSDWSELVCPEHHPLPGQIGQGTCSNCCPDGVHRNSRRWRTRAAYVDEIPDLHGAPW